MDEGRAGGPGVNDYDAFATAYAAENEVSPVNAHYERPAMLNLAGNVAGRRILDAGCGAGALSEALIGRGAHVTGLDSSNELLKMARARLGAEVDLRLSDLADPLPFAGGIFDDVVASLVLHYLKDWGPTLTEFRRVLRAGGRLLVSVDHPFVAYHWQRLDGEEADYFATYQWSFDWVLEGRSMPMRFWVRPLHAMADAFAAADFHILTISEPPPQAHIRDSFPEVYRSLSTSPSFLFFVLRTQ